MIKRARRDKGVFLVEAMIAIGVVALVILAFIGTYRVTNRSLTQSRVKKQVAQFVQADLQLLANLARLPERDVVGNLVLAGGKPKVWGYNQIVSEPDQLNSYPRVLQKETQNDSIYVLYRRLVVVVKNQGLPDEYKEVTVTLRDSQNPERFQPMSMTSNIRKPDIAGLDTRVAHDVASLTVAMVDEETASLICSTCGSPSAGLSGQGTLPMHAGPLSFGSLNTQTQYTATFTATGYWREIHGIGPSQAVVLSVGSNEPSILNPVTMQPVYYGTVTVRVSDTSSQLLGGVEVKIDHPGTPFPLTHPHTGITNAANYTQYTDETGIAGRVIAIPRQSSTTYGGVGSGYRVTKLIKQGYFDKSPQQYFPITRNAVTGPLDFTMDPVRYAQLRVTVVDPSNVPINGVHVRVYAHTDYYSNTDLTNGNITPLFNYYGGYSDLWSKVDSNEVYFSSIPINTPSSVGDTTRKVWVRVQKAGYKQVWVTQPPADNTGLTLSEGVEQALTVVLQPHALRLVMYPSSDPINTIPVSISSTQFVVARACYAGDDGRSGINTCCNGDCSSGDAPSTSFCGCGELDILKTKMANQQVLLWEGGVWKNCPTWQWGVPSGGVGYLLNYNPISVCPYFGASPGWPITNTQDRTTFYPTNTGTGDFTATVSMIDWRMKEYNTASGSWMNTAFTLTATSSTYVAIGGVVVQRPLEMNLTGPNSVPPNPSGNGNYSAYAAYVTIDGSTAGLPPLLKFKWTLSAPDSFQLLWTGAVTGTGQNYMRAKSGGNTGDSTIMRACVYSPNTGCNDCDANNECSACNEYNCKSVSKTVDIAIPTLNVSFPHSDDADPVLFPVDSQNNVGPVTVSGGSGLYAYSWVLLEEGGAYSGDKASLSNSNASTVTVSVRHNVRLRLYLTVTDTQSGATGVADLEFYTPLPGNETGP